MPAEPRGSAHNFLDLADLHSRVYSGLFSAADNSCLDKSAESLFFDSNLICPKIKLEGSKLPILIGRECSSNASARILDCDFGAGDYCTGGIKNRTLNVSG